MKNKDVPKLLAGSITFVLVLGIISPVYAGMTPNLPLYELAEVQDNGSIVDLIIWALSPIPDPAPGASGYGVITGTNGGNTALIVTTSHATVCDSEDQTLGVCEGLWHQHHVVLVADPICDNTPAGGGLRVQNLSFESPGVVTPPGGTAHISFWNAPRSESATDAIPATFPAFSFGTADPVTPTYPTVAFDIWVNPALGLDSDGIPVPNPGTGLREVCVYNVVFVEAPNAPKVGGEFLGIDTAALLIAGFKASALWMLPTIAGIAGVGIFLTKFRANKED